MPKEITLEQQIAYLLRNPITKPEQMPTPLVTEPIDAEWQEWIDKQWWTTKYKTADDIKPDPFPWAPGRTAEMFKLRDLLLSFGGSQVCMPGYDEDAARIIERGQLWYGDRIHMMRGRPSQCHRNSSYCWEANQDKTVLCTGYALSEDGMWRCHSWLVELRPRRNRIVETTEPRIAYFGFGMTTEEAWDFYFDNE
jgi:hypothetical protein